MAEHAPNTTPITTTTTVAKKEEQVAAVVTDVVADKTETASVVADIVEKEKALEPLVEESVTLGSHLSRPNNDEKLPEPETGSLKEETTKLSNENKALQELKQLIQEALNNHHFFSPPTKEQHDKKEKQAESKQETKAAEEVATKTEEGEKKEQVEETEVVAEVKQAVSVAVTVVVDALSSVDEDGAKTVEAIEETVVSSVQAEQPPPQQPEEKVSEADTKETNKVEEASSTPLTPEQVSIYGVPLLADEKSDVILLKFLRARDFKVKEAFTMISNTIRWRKEFGIDELVEENLGDELEKVVYMHGFDKEGHPVCYNIYGEFNNRELYKKTFSDEEKRDKFMRWRIQFLEKSIRKLDFNPGGICTIVQVNDLKNSPGPGKWELRQATKQALQLLQDNYPEFVAKQVFINVPWWYLAVNRMISPFLTQRTKSKFVFSGPSKSAETLLSYIAPEQLHVNHGGLSKYGESENTDAVTEITVRPATKQTVEFPVTENSLLSWEVRVIGWEVSYGAEFVPSSEESYTVIIQKGRKVASSEEPVLLSSFKVGEPGKVVLTIDNPTSKKKKILYRLKTKPSPSE
ncbi:PREDICTED: patellin-3-like [Lupinus angustifolius]|uniref:patellin-3-like n=1 Tax=Lupinus angustifolius TaxID=3871 RepID=UPI00092FC99C|nr:PREDICTED: patellin-3-like [Lupinus angustifolius]